MEKIYKNWTFHNLFAHPIGELLYLLGFEKLSNDLHDGTIPEHIKGTGRG